MGKGEKDVVSIFNDSAEWKVEPKSAHLKSISDQVIRLFACK